MMVEYPLTEWYWCPIHGIAHTTSEANASFVCYRRRQGPFSSRSEAEEWGEGENS